MIPMLSVPILSFSLRGANPAIKVRGERARTFMTAQSDLMAVEQLKQKIEVLQLQQQINALEAQLQPPAAAVTPAPALAEEAAARAAQEAAARAAQEAAAQAAQEA